MEKNFHTFKRQVSIGWELFKKSGLPKAKDKPKLTNPLNKIKDVHVTNDSFVAIDPFFQEPNNPFVSAVSALHSYDDSTDSSDKSLVDLLEQARPIVSQRQARHPALLGLGLGFISSLFITQFFGSSNTQDIQKLNDMIRQNKLLKLTNQRIDNLAKNVSNQISTIKTILDKVVESREMQDIGILNKSYKVLLFSKKEFKSGEVTVTLLEKDILNPGLVNLDSLNITVTEGLLSFPNLEFPVELNKYNIPQIIKLLKVQIISNLKFLVIIPLTNKRHKAYSLIPYPVKIHHTLL